MRIAVVGAGALGSVVGVLLLEAGLDTVFVERDHDKVRLIRENGLWLEGVSGERIVRPAIYQDLSEAGLIDLALVLVKSYDTRSAISTLEQILPGSGLVLTLQNGIGNYETLDEAFPGRVLLGTTTMGAMYLAPGRYRHTGFGSTHFGEADGTIRERTRAIGSVLEKMNSGPVHVVDNAVGCVWSKLIINAAINAPCTLLAIRNGRLPETDSGKELIYKIVSECLMIVRAKGIGLIFEDPADQVIGVCRGTSENINSMLQDILAGRPTEIDFINGALAREAEELGFAAPVNKTLALLIKARETKEQERVPTPA
ncbi:MAG: ketopantoate reductase family protein [Deltaproteobacteria bacterium]|jgi:2-dehydropantoate 2-reductase|nr:ketopantoate reductase family protein [Deltaproteobacteria bacterium]